MWCGDSQHWTTTRPVHANFPKPMGWHRDGILTHSAFPTHTFWHFFLPSEATFCLPFWLTLKSRWKVLPMDWLWRLCQANVHQAEPFEDSRRLCSVHWPHGCKHPLFCQIVVLSIAAPPPHPIQHKSEWRLHHPQEESRLAPHGLSHESEGHLPSDSSEVRIQTVTSHAKTSMMECCTAH